MRFFNTLLTSLLVFTLIGCQTKKDENPNIKQLELYLTIPEAIQTTDFISIGSNINNWDPSDSLYAMTKIDPTSFILKLEIDVSLGSQTIEYKYTIQSIDNENPWSKVEKGSNNEEINNRVIKISKDSPKITKVEDRVLMFNSLSSKSTVIGNLDLYTLDMTPLNRKRTIRVWTPTSYDPNGTKKYPVLYMQDGQNLFDQYTSFAGEWGIDESIEALIKDKGIDGFIVVGIDNGGALRMDEYTPNWVDQPTKEGALYGRFIVEALKPFIDKNYHTLAEKEHTLIGGSSMGGLISFYIGLKHKDTFGHILAMSSSFQINTQDARLAFINTLEMNDLPKLYLDSGYPGDNSKYVDLVKQELLDKGYLETLIFTKKTEGHSHNEKAWQLRFPEAISWLFNL